MLDLSGRVALVTGAGQGVGEGIAHGLAAQGAAVIVNDLFEERASSVAKAIEAGGARALAQAFDVTDAEGVTRGIADAASHVGPVDILVNNAGVPPGMGLTPFREMEPASWARFVDVNLYGVLHCSKAVIDGMCERGFGRIVTISSGAGQVGLPIGVSLYAAGKAGAMGFMRHLALEVARHGVTANTLAIGLMNNQQDTESVAPLARTIPVGRLGEPEDIAAMVAFLASNEAGWITGQTIGVNGGSVTS